MENSLIAVNFVVLPLIDTSTHTVVRSLYDIIESSIASRCKDLVVMASLSAPTRSVSHVPPAGTGSSPGTGSTTSTAACSANTTDPQHSSTAI